MKVFNNPMKRNFKSIALIVLSTILMIGCSTTSRTKIQHRNEQVHPLLLRKLLPSLSTNQNNICLNWKSNKLSETIEEINETVLANKGIWYRSYFSQTGFADYTIIGNYKKNRCLILRESEGTLNRAYILFIKLKCKKVCLKGVVEIKDLKNDFVKIEGNNLFVGDTKYDIQLLFKKQNN